MTEKIVGEIINSNVFVVGNEESCFIVDAGVEPNKVDEIVRGRKVLGVLLTHGHYDHAFYALNYAEKFGCPIFAKSGIEVYLQNPEWNYSEGKFKVSDFSKFHFLNKDGEIKLGDFNISYKSLGGHSESDIMFKFNNEIFVGDVLLGRDMGRIDLYGGSKEKMAASLRILIDENYDIMHCGHGQDCTKLAQDKVAKLWLKFLER